MIEIKRPVSRQVPSLYYGTLMATISEEGIYLREKGRRKRFLLPWSVAYRKAADLEALRLRLEKARDVKTKKAAKRARRGKL